MKTSPQPEPVQLIATRSDVIRPRQSHDIYVHQHCIERGKLRTSGLCPIGLALIQHFGTTEVMVCITQIYVEDRTYKNNSALCETIRNMDRGFTMLPFHIRLQ